MALLLVFVCLLNTAISWYLLARVNIYKAEVRKLGERLAMTNELSARALELVGEGAQDGRASNEQ